MASIYTTLLDLFRAISKNDGNTDSLNVSGTVTALPGTGAATSAKQDTGNTSLASIDSKLTAPLTVSLPSGASTAANQTNGSQITQIADPITGIKAQVSIANQLQTTTDPVQVFNESFEGGVIDVTNRWSSPVLAGTGTVTQSSSLGLLLTVGTTANNAGALSSQNSFATQYGSATTLAFGAKLETTIATGNYRFFGYGTRGTAYSTTNPIANGIGFEITTAGVLRAVIYASDVLVFSQNLTISTDGLEHVYAIQTRGNFTLWYVDIFSYPAATAQLQSPDVTLLPIRFSSLNGGSTTVGTPTTTIYGLSILDTGRNALQIADGTYPWRRAVVTAAGSLTSSIPAKTYVSGGVAAPSTTYNNLLDPILLSTPNDVRFYNSATVTVLSNATTGSYIFEGAWVSDFTTGGTVTLKAEEITVTTGASLINAAITPTNATRVFRINLSDVNYFRMRVATGITSGILIGNVNFTQSQVSPAQMAVVQATGSNLNTVIASGTVTTVTTVSSVTAANLAIPGIIADVASAALTTTTTTATLTPTFGISYKVNIPVTVVSGTTPTLDIQIQESSDTGTNWNAVYDFPRITATGSYNSPVLTFTGNRIRYVQTVTGTTPSFTRAINRLQISRGLEATRQLFDRAISLDVLNSTTSSLVGQNTKNVQLVLDIGLTTIAPILQIQGSDDLGGSWYAVGSTLTAVASSTVSLTVNNVTSQQYRAIVTSAGTGSTLNYVLLRVF